MLSCPLCTKAFRYLRRLDRHMVTHTKEKPHKCLMCPAAFGRTDLLKAHMKRVHEGMKNKKCLLCSYKCYSNTMLKIHVRKHSAELPFSCQITGCDYRTKYKGDLSKHALQAHSEKRPYQCPSDGCSYKAKRRTHIRQHLRVHSNDKPFACTVPECNYTCKSKGYLKSHTSSVHCDERPFKCPVCDFRTKCNKALRSHELTHTANIKRFECKALNCGFASHRKRSLEQHLDRKHRKKGVICTEPRCNFRCSNIALLKQHLKRHRNPLLKCPGGSCNFSTRYRTCFLSHVSREHQDVRSATMVQRKKFDLEIVGAAGAIKTLHCPFPNCGYQTKFPHCYDRHRITHNKEEKREHVCSFCFFRFSTSTALRSHIQIHTGEKPYSCSHCKYSTVDRYSLRKHAKRAHNILVVPSGEEHDVRKCRTCSKTFWSYEECVLHSTSHLQPVVVLQQLKLQIL